MKWGLKLDRYCSAKAHADTRCMNTFQQSEQFEDAGKGDKNRLNRATVPYVERSTSSSIVSFVT